MKLFLKIALVLFFSSSLSVFAGKSSGCGLGVQVFGGQSGVVPNVLAVTTNGSSGIQTFGITSGTSGCNSSDTVLNSIEADTFIVENEFQLIQNISQGNGEYLDIYSEMMNCKNEQFAKSMQENFAELVKKKNTKQFIAHTKEVIQSDQYLQSHCS